MQARHVEISIGKVQGRHVRIFLLVCLIVKNQKKISLFLFVKSWFRQTNPDMCQKKIGKVQSRHVNSSIGKVQARHVRISLLVCLIVKNQKKFPCFSFQNLDLDKETLTCARKRFAKCNLDM